MHKFLTYPRAEGLVKCWAAGKGFDLWMGKETEKYTVNLKFPKRNGAGCFYNRKE